MGRFDKRCLQNWMQEETNYWKVNIALIQILRKMLLFVHILKSIELIIEKVDSLEQWFSTFFRLRHLLTHNFFCDTQLITLSSLEKQLNAPNHFLTMKNW